MSEKEISATVDCPKVTPESNGRNIDLEKSLSRTKTLIVTLGEHNIIPVWTVAILLSWGGLEDA